MDHALAKELKDAGFPQFFSEGMAYYDKQGNFCESACSEYNNDKDWAIRVPTLSELIEACGQRFGNLIRKRYECRWEVCSDELDHRAIIADGSTPEEAVARLWLTLNKAV